MRKKPVEHKIKENAEVGLHDCRTDHIKYEEQSVTFYFPKGFYLIQGTDISETGKAEMRCRLLDKAPDGFSVYIYRKNIFGKVIREDWSESFVSAINAGKFEFEFVDTYRARQFILFKGYVWFDKKPYCMECEIELHTDEITYSRTD